MYNIEYSKRAKNDLLRLYEYIFLNLENPIAARNFIAQITKSISNLKYFPFIGTRYYNTCYRYILFKNYIIFYYIGKIARFFCV